MSAPQQRQKKPKNKRSDSIIQARTKQGSTGTPLFPRLFSEQVESVRLISPHRSLADLKYKYEDDTFIEHMVYMCIRTSTK